MSKRKKVLVLTFVMGFLATAFSLPILYGLGVPSFNIVLVNLFGEGSIWAVGFSLLLILSIAFGVGKVMNSYT